MGWSKSDIKIELPEPLIAIFDVIGTIADVLDAIITVIKVLLNIAKILYGGIFDPFWMLVSAMVSQIQALIEDTFGAGVYMLIVNPWNIENPRYGKLSKFELEEGETKPYIKYSGKTDATGKTTSEATSKDVEAYEFGVKYSTLGLKQTDEYYDLDPEMMAMLTPKEAIDIAIKSLDDEGDSNRPQFSDDAMVKGLGFLLTASSPGEFANMLTDLGKLMNLGEISIGFKAAKKKEKKKAGPSEKPNWSSLNFKSTPAFSYIYDIMEEIKKYLESWEVEDSFSKLINIMIKKVENMLKIVAKFKEILSLLKGLSVNLWMLDTGDVAPGGNKYLKSQLSSSELEAMTTTYTMMVLFVAGGPGAGSLDGLAKLWKKVGEAWKQAMLDFNKAWDDAVAGVAGAWDDIKDAVKKMVSGIDITSEPEKLKEGLGKSSNDVGKQGVDLNNDSTQKLTEDITEKFLDETYMEEVKNKADNGELDYVNTKILFLLEDEGYPSPILRDSILALYTGEEEELTDEHIITVCKMFGNKSIITKFLKTMQELSAETTQPSALSELAQQVSNIDPSKTLSDECLEMIKNLAADGLSGEDLNNIQESCDKLSDDDMIEIEEMSKCINNTTEELIINLSHIGFFESDLAKIKGWSTELSDADLAQIKTMSRYFSNDDLQVIKNLAIGGLSTSDLNMVKSLANYTLRNRIRNDLTNSELNTIKSLVNRALTGFNGISEVNLLKIKGLSDYISNEDIDVIRELAVGGLSDDDLELIRRLSFKKLSDDDLNQIQVARPCLKDEHLSKLKEYSDNGFSEEELIEIRSWNDCLQDYHLDQIKEMTRGLSEEDFELLEDLTDMIGETDPEAKKDIMSVEEVSVLRKVLRELLRDSIGKAIVQMFKDRKLVTHDLKLFRNLIEDLLRSEELIDTDIEAIEIAFGSLLKGCL